MSFINIILLILNGIMLFINVAAAYALVYFYRGILRGQQQIDDWIENNKKTERN